MLANSSTIAQISIDVRNGDCLPPNSLCEIRKLSNDIHAVNSDNEKYILCAHAAHHSDFIEPIYFDNLSKLLIETDETIRQCVLWAFTSTMACSVALTPTNIDLVYNLLTDKSLGWSASFFFRKLSENEEYTKMISDGIWISMIDLLFDQKMDEQVCIIIVQTISNIFRSRKSISNEIKRRLQILIMSDNVSEKLLLAAIHALKMLVIDEEQLEPETLKRLQELMIMSNETVAECAREFHYILHDKQTLSNVQHHTRSSQMKSELVATQNILISHSKEEFIEPTNELLPLDYLISQDDQTDQTFNQEHQSKVIRSGDHQPFYYTMMMKIKNLHHVARQGELTLKDFFYLTRKLKKDSYTFLTLEDTSTVHERIIEVLRSSAEVEQNIPRYVVDTIIDCLTPETKKLNRLCVDCLLIILGKQHQLENVYIDKIEQILMTTNDMEVKQKLIEIYADCASKGHHVQLDLESIQQNLQSKTSCVKVSYLFFKAVAVEKRTLSPEQILILTDVAMSKHYLLKARENCSWALAYNIKETKDKKSFSSKLLDDLGLMLEDPAETIRHSSALAVCYYADDNNCDVPDNILERLAVVSLKSDSHISCNILSVYLKLTKRKYLPTVILDNICNLIYHPEFDLRYRSIWILKCAVDNGQELTSNILKIIDYCLKSSESGVCNTAGMIFVNYWRQRIVRNDRDLAFALSSNIENLVFIFRNRLELNVRREALHLLKLLVDKNYDLTNTLLQLIEYCFYDSDASISICAVNILTSYSKQHILPTRTIICLENLLTTETANVADILPVLKKVVDQGHMLSEKSITHLGYLLLKIDDPNNVVILLSHVDRYQPLSKTVNDLLRQDYYTKILRYSTCARSLDEAISGFINLTANGTQLSQSVLDSLFFLLKSSDRQMKLMPIVVNVTENGQQLKNNEHICTLTRIFFDSDDKSLIDLVRIFRNLSRMNQVIPDPVIEFLENFLVNSLLTGYIIEIFQHLIERQKLKNQSIIGKVLKMLHFSESTVMNTEIYYRLVRFCKVVANNQPNEIDQARILSMLQFTQSAIVRKDGCTLAKALAEHGQTLTTSVMDALVHILNNDTDINIQEYALTVMNLANSDNQNMDNDFVQMLDTIDHQNTTDDEFLLEISRKISRTSLKLSEKDLLRLSHMLYTCNIDSKRKAASYIVSVAENGRKLLDEIFHIIYATLRDDTVNIYTIKLLLRSSVKQPAFLINDLLYLVVYSMHSVVREKAQKILADHGDNPKVQLFFNTERNPENLDKMVSNYDVYLIEKLSSNNENEIFMALKVIQNMITVEKQIASDLLLAVTLKLNTHNDIVADILCATMIHRSRIEEDIYQEIEKTFLIYQTPKMMNLIRILAEQQIELESKTIKTVFNILCRRTDEKALCRDAVIIMEQIARHQLLSKEILSYFVERISNESKEDIQTSFNVIRYQILHSQMDDMLDSLPIIPLPQGIDNQRLFQLKTFEQYLGTVQTLLFVDSFNPTVLNWPAERWSRECLCFDLLKRYQDATPDSVYIFYHQLTLLEISRQYGFYSDVRDLILQTLIQKQCTYSLDLGTISDLLIYLTILKNNPLQMLQANEPNWLLNMRRYYVREKMSQYLSDSIFSKSMIDHIVDRITEQENLPAELIELFLQTAIKPEHILIFLHLMSDYGLTKNDVTSLFASLKVTSGFKTLKKQMECFILNRTLASRWFGSPNDLALGRVYLEALLNNGWTFVRLNDMLKAIKIDSDTFDTFKEFLVCLKIIVDYEMNENSETELNTIFSTIGHQLWRSKVHSIAIENQFGLTSSEKNLFMLLTEIDHVNKTRFLTELTQTMSTIDQAFRCDSSVLRQNKPISEWTISHIQKWAQQFLLQQSEKLSGVRLYEIMAVIKRAIYLDLNVEPRAIQLVSVLIVLDSNHQRGRLLQILTGEGKSTIVSILAVIKALEHKKVDIVTSSMVLAKRDARKRQIFYNMFNLTVACNDDVTSYVSGQKACYQADIVYGTCSQFQFDILRHEYSLLDTRKDRGYDVVIIDEVDSMLIDENSTIARLADPLPGMEYLNPLLYGICQSVNNDEEVEANRDGIVEQIKDLINNPKPAIKIPCHLHDFVHQSIPSWVDHAIRAKIEYRLDHHYLIKTDEIGVKRITPIDYSNTGVIQCNTTFSNGAHQCLQIKHGLKMTPLTVTTNYMSNVGLFTRYKNQIYGFTGTLGSESAKDLLRKVYNVDTIVIPSFKEKRHFSFNAILTSTDEEWLETITSNTVNNMDLNRAVLIICETILDAKTVAKAVQRAYPTGTVHLYTDNTDAIEPNVISNRIQPRQIIVATNLVGRGTDLQTSPDVENSGGLHVCLTFLPDNLRVEQQALGRTSRQGNRGTSQMILRLHRLQLQMSYPEYACGNEKDLTDPIRFIYEWREKAECAHLDRILEREVPEIKEKDDLFRQFCDLLGKLRTQDNDFYKLLSVKERWALWSKSVEHAHQARQALEKKIINAGFRLVDIPRDANSAQHTCFIGYEVNTHYVPVEPLDPGNELAEAYLGDVDVDDVEILTLASENKIKSIVSTGLHNLWTDKKQQKLHDLLSVRTVSTDLKTGFNDFQNQILEEYKTNKIIKNPYYLILEANETIAKLASWLSHMRSITSHVFGNEKMKSIDDAIAKLKQAIELDPVFAFSASVTLAYLAIHKHEPKHTYKIDAKSYLVQAQKNLEQFILPQLYSMHRETNENNAQDFFFDDFGKQTQMKIEILELYQHYVSQAIGIIESSQKLVDVSSTNNGTVLMGKKMYGNEIKKFIQKHQGTIELSFHDLTVHNDIIKHDQALNLLALLPDDYKHISINIMNGNRETIDEIFSETNLSTLTLTIPYLNGDELINLVQENFVDLTLTGSIEQYKRAINSYPSVVVLETDLKRERLSQNDGIQAIKLEGNVIKSVCFESIDLQIANTIVKNVEKVRYSLTFNQVPISQMREMIKTVPKSFSCKFQNLTKWAAYNFVKNSNECSFILSLSELTNNHACDILENFDRNEHDVNASLKAITEHFMSSDQLYEELNIFKNLGVSQLIVINELHSRPWISVSTVALLGIGQIIGGVCLGALSGCVGGSLALSLIYEGVSDIYYAIKGAISRQLSFRDYAIQKGISLSICFISIGLSAVSKGAKAVQTGTQSTMQLLKQTAQEAKGILKNGVRVLTKGAIQGTAKVSWVLACEKVGITCVTTGIREIANYSLDITTNKVLSSARSTISDEIERIINTERDNEVYNRILNRALSADAYFENDRWALEIEELVIKILTKQKNGYVEIAKSLGKGFGNVLLNHTKQFAAEKQKKNINDFLNIGQTLHSVYRITRNSYEILTITNTFLDTFMRELTELTPKIPTFQDLLVSASNRSISLEMAEKAHQLLVDSDILTKNGAINARFHKLEETCDFVGQHCTSHEYIDEPVRSFKGKLVKEVQQIDFASNDIKNYVLIVLNKLITFNKKSLRMSIIHKKIVQQLADQIILILHANVMAHLTTYIAQVIDSFSDKIQLKLSSKGTVSQQLMENCALREINVLSNDLVRDYQSGKIQLAADAVKKLHDLKKKSKDENFISKNFTEELALRVSDNKPGTIIEIGILAALTGVPICVIPHYTNNELSEEKNVNRIEYSEPYTDEFVNGHYGTAMDGVVTDGRQDCMYAAMLRKSSNRYQSIQDMRTTCAAFILTNPDYIASVLPAIDVIYANPNVLRQKQMMMEGGSLRNEQN
ncbi:unnamed protein product [Didymodactylos carnosus]|uniref:Protein translocase subunit SecA n=1 Tax=Didymodactylos carnosus TaxID=1234261 RepID=A0A813PNX6_9BILA|nr:unnamed protein product [Didymodactylos carnosus]CAF3533200.1 unnamed protein product [Didymodactylos carnosus]